MVEDRISIDLPGSLRPDVFGPDFVPLIKPAESAEHRHPYVMGVAGSIKNVKVLFICPDEWLPGYGAVGDGTKV